jgi:O-antigen ligase
VVGLHALAQFLLSFFEVYDPFVMQRAGITTIARGQSWTYEPSYYALFAIPFVVCLNARYLLKEEGLKFWKVLGANLLLLVSTSTGGFFSYFIFFLVCLILSSFCFVKRHFPHLRARVGKFLMGFCLFFCSIGLFFLEMFQHTFYKFFYLGLLTHWSFQERWDKIVEGWEIFCASPLFGIGLRGVEKYSYLMARFDNPAVSLYGPINAREMYHAHTPSNVFVEVLSSLGVYGFCAIVLLSILICQLFCASMKDERLMLQERKMILAFFISIIVMVCCLQFNQELFRNYVWAHMGISVGYVLRSREELKNDSADRL